MKKNFSGNHPRREQAMKDKSKKSLSIVFLVSVVLVSFYASAKAVTVYVDAANTSGIEDGTQAYPFNTIQEGINAAKEGDSFESADTVKVAPGIYYGGGIRLKHNVRLIGSGPEVTIIDCLNDIYYCQNGNGVAIRLPYHSEPRGYIEGFTLQNGWCGVYASNPYSFWQLAYLEVRNCIIKNMASSGISIYPGVQIRIFKTVFERIGCSAIACTSSTQVELTNVTINNVTYGSAIHLYNATVYLKNNNISNVPALFSVASRWGSGTVIGKNNCLWNYLKEWKLLNNNPHEFVNLNPVYADPMYVNAISDNYHLQPLSPCINKGVDIGLPYSGSAPDLGAYEYEELNTRKLIENLASSYANASLDSFKNSAEQRINALENKFTALLNKLDEIEEIQDTQTKITLYRDALDKLINDLWAKADGFFGGNPKNDWITTREEQERLYPIVQQLKKNIENEINKLIASLTVKEQSAPAPNIIQTKNTLSQNYPNPFNPSTTIGYTIEKDCQVILKLYNVAGQLVATVVDEYQTAGPHKVVFDAGESLSRGIYYYQLKAGDFVATKKMVVLR